MNRQPNEHAISTSRRGRVVSLPKVADAGAEVRIHALVNRAHDDLLVVAASLENGDLHLSVMRALRYIRNVDDRLTEMRETSKLANAPRRRARNNHNAQCHEPEQNEQAV